MKISYESLVPVLCSMVAVLLTAGVVHAGDVDVNVRASAGMTYDDNYAFVETNRPSDFISTLKVGMSLTYENKRSDAQISADIVQNLFTEHTEESNTAEFVTVAINREFSKYDYVKLSDSFSHTEDPSTFDEEFGRVAGRYSYYRNRFDAVYEKELTEKFRTEFGYGNDLDFAGRSDLVDSVANRFSAEGIYAFSSERSLFGAYNILHRKLDPGDSAVVNSFSGGLRQYFTEQVSLEGRFGVDLIDDYAGDVNAHPFFSATLTDRVTDRTSAHVTFSQRHSTTPYAADVFDSWRIAGAIDSQLLKKLKVSTTAFYGQGQYEDSDIEDDLVGASLGLIYDIRENIQGNVSYEYSQAMSNSDSREYERNVVFFGISSEY